MCCIPLFCLVKWSDGVKEIGLWDLCGFEDFEKRGQWAQKNEIRAICPPKNFKLFYDEGGDFFVGFRTKFRWPLARVSVKFEECICCSLYMCSTFCLLCLRFLSHTFNGYCLFQMMNVKKK